MKEFWDQRYSTKEYIYGKAPNAHFKQFIHGLNPGRLLLPGDGEGRNAVYAASLGWDVHAVDQSAEARCKALALAEEKGVVINYTVGDLNKINLDGQRYDAISLVFLHLPPSIRKSVHQKLLNVLNPGGLMHMIAFTPDQLDFKTGGPQDVTMLYTPEMVRGDFPGLSDIRIDIIKDEFSEGVHHGPYRALELVGTKFRDRERDRDGMRDCPPK